MLNAYTLHFVVFANGLVMDDSYTSEITAEDLEEVYLSIADEEEALAFAVNFVEESVSYRAECIGVSDNETGEYWTLEDLAFTVELKKEYAC